MLLLMAIKIFNFVIFNIVYSLVKTEYLILFIYFLIALLLAFLIFLFSYLLALQKPNLEKLSAYECGFEPYGNSRTQFELRFYLIAILFLIFDLETVFLFPFALNLSKLDLLGFWSVFDFVIELLISFFYVWYIGALNWD